MSIASKLQLKPGQTVSLVGVSPGTTIELGSEYPRTEEASLADAVIVFAAHRAELETSRGLLVRAAQREALTWVAYPKGGQLGSDLNRDSLAELLRAEGVRPVRQIAIDDVWSALRFRKS